MTVQSRGATLLVTGGAGFLGSTVVRDLVATFPGRIVSVRRTPPRGLPEPHGLPAPDALAEPRGLPEPHLEHRCDLEDGPGWHHLLAEADYVLWMAALRDHGASSARAYRQNVAPLRAAVAVLRGSGRLKRFVFTSSISALDQPPHPARPRILTDGSPAFPSTPYGRSKLAAERLLLGSGLPVTVLRLPFLYGPGFRPGSFLDFYRQAAANPLLSAVRYTANLSLMYTGDVAGLVLAVLGGASTAAADASPYLVSDGHPGGHEVDGLVTSVAGLHGRRRPPVRLPTAAGRAAAALALRSRAMLPARPVGPGRGHLLATYWSHAAFTRDYFVVDSGRFHAAFPQCSFTEVDAGLAASFPAAVTPPAAARAGVPPAPAPTPESSR